MTRDESVSCLFGFGLGALCMYLMDPAAGNRRRALMRDKAIDAARKTADGSAALARDLRHRSEGVAARWRNRGSQDSPDDAVLEARVRSALGRATTHPGAIGVTAIVGRVLLVGPVLESEHDAIYRAVANVRGVVDVDDQLTVHASAESIPGLQGEGSLPASSWLSSPTTQLVAGLATAAIGVAMMRRHAA